MLHTRTHADFGVLIRDMGISRLCAKDVIFLLIMTGGVSYNPHVL